MEGKKKTNSEKNSEEIISDKGGTESKKVYNQIKESSKNIIDDTNKRPSVCNSSEFPIENENNEDTTIKTEKELIKNKGNINNNKNNGKEKIKDLYEEKELKGKTNITQNKKKDKEKKKCCKSCYNYCGCNKRRKDFCNVFCRYCCDNIYRNCNIF